MIELLNVLYIIAIALIICLIILIIVQKYYLIYKAKTEPSVRKYLFNKLEQLPQKDKHFSNKRLFRSIQKIEDQLRLSDESRRILLNEAIQANWIEKLKKSTKSIFKYRRLMGAYHLSFYPQHHDHILSMIEKENNDIILFYLFYFTKSYIDEQHFSIIMNKIKGVNYEVLHRFSVVIANHIDLFKDRLIDYMDFDVYEHMYIQLKTASKHLGYVLPSHTITFFKQQLDTPCKNEKEKHMHKLILDYLTALNHPYLVSKNILNHESKMIRFYGYKALAKERTWGAVITLFNQLGEDDSENQFIIQLISSMSDHSSIMNKLFYYAKTLKDALKKKSLAQILSDKIETIVVRMTEDEEDMAINNLRLIIEHRFLSGLIAFLNNNNDREIESRIFSIIQSIVEDTSNQYQDLFIYLRSDILRRYGYKQLRYKAQIKEKQPIEFSKIIWLLLMLIIALAFYPVLSIIQQWDTLGSVSLRTFFENLVLDTNRNLIYYFLVANFIYLLLLIVSFKGSHYQNILWDIKSQTMLYEEDLLPAISIIAPAYNEEVNIITSVRSLLNLKYPEYEVIVVNDGSKDRTLEVLIDHFKLKRQNTFVEDALKTKRVRGIYKNSEYPRLIVVNKVNGGKADALNVGINVSNHPYICGIDADSVLDQDALLRLMSSSIDQREKAVALGGNIVPANGCVIDYGHVEEKHFPKETLTRFQAVEYLRAFTTGRIGWSQLKSLLIISGAFGLFYKDDIIDIGGYITSSGELKKDSVGEDMELVVRLTYHRMKASKNHYIGYIYHANCYTELPSDLKTLLKQRNRWHRGLIDILNYHRRIFLNIKYKQIGFVAMPYFYIFEVLGPFFEWIGYIALILSFVFGFLSAKIVLMIFGLSIILGIIISLFSLYIQESRSTYMRKKEMIPLVIFSILENIGYRQLLSIHRIYSFFTALFEKGKWGDQKRKGI